MLRRMAEEDSEAETINSETTTTTSTTGTSDSDRIDHNDKSRAMSSVFNKDDSSNSDHPPRSASPLGSKAFNLPFRKGSNTSHHEKKKSKEESGMARWLRDGTVIYKSVGLGLMDLVVGNHLVKIANEKKVGTQVPGF